MYWEKSFRYDRKSKYKETGIAYDAESVLSDMKGKTQFQV